MHIENSVVLVTGAAGGLGTVMIDALLARGARKVYAAVRVDDAGVAWPANVVPLQLDVTSAADVARAVALAPDATILVNNAGLNRGQAMLSTLDPDAARAEMDVNYFGMLAMCRAFAPQLIAGQGGAVINVLSVLARVSLPMMGSLCASKAAALRLTDSLRAELRQHDVQVLAVLPGVIDTAMSATFPGPKALPQDVVATLLDALEQGADEVYPDAMALDVERRLGSERGVVSAEFSGYL